MRGNYHIFYFFVKKIKKTKIFFKNLKKKPKKTTKRNPQILKKKPINTQKNKPRMALFLFVLLFLFSKRKRDFVLLFLFSKRKRDKRKEI